MWTLRFAFAWKYALRTSITKSTVPFWLLDAASEMTSFTPSTSDVALNKSGLGPVLYSFANHRDLVFGHSDVPLLVTAQPVLMGFSLLSFQHWLMGTFFVHRARLYVLHLLLTRLPNQDWIQPSSLTSSQYFPSTICPPSLRRLRLFSSWEVKSTGLTFVSLAKCIRADVWPTLPNCCRGPSQISEPRLSGRLDPSTRLAIRGLFVRKSTRPPSSLSLSSPSAWNTSCLHSKRVMHGRESCDASPL